MSEYPAFDLPPGYQFDPCGIPGFDPAVTFDIRGIPGLDPALISPTPETPETPEPTFELLLTLVHPSKRPRTSNRRPRNLKPESESIGPFDVAVNIGWDAFLGMVAEKTCIQRSGLPVTTFEWHWLKPSSGPWLPVRDKNGLASMLKKIKSKSNSKSETYVIVRMEVPGKNQASASSGNVRDIGEETDLDLEENPVSKKMKLDNEIEEIIINLMDRYPEGMCPRHPDLPCFHYRTADLHFNLDRQRLLVWAQAIKSGTATYERIPVLSPMFTADKALKRASKSSTKSPTPPTTPPTTEPSMPVPTQVQMPAMPLPTFFQYPQIPFPQVSPQMPLFMGYGGMGMPYSGNPFTAGAGMEATPIRPSRYQSRSPPSSPPTANCSIADFCESYNLGPQAESGLDHLGFEFGDDLSTVTESQYTKAGFKPLEWRRVLKAYRQLKVDNRHVQ